jgi:hypothetical protein
MKIGTKSILIGAHCFFIHPIFVASAWIKLYSFPLDPRIWLSFFLHDIGYIGKSNMDGPEGKTHPLLGAKIMSIFGKKWYDFNKYHSRYYIKLDNKEPSKLCYADKLAISLEPNWLYIPRTTWTKEINEYIKDWESKTKRKVTSKKEWFNEVKQYLRKWAINEKIRKEESK